jgi:hypothetical protein
LTPPVHSRQLFILYIDNLRARRFHLEADTLEDSAMPRGMTDAEKKDFRQLFSRMDVDRASVTGEATPIGGPVQPYNCIAWTIGSTTEWIDLTTRQEFDDFYARRGFVAGAGRAYKVAAWGIVAHPVRMMHACVYFPPDKAESKFGELLRAVHVLGELGPEYGTVMAYYSHASPPVKRARHSTVLTNNQTAVVGAQSAKLSPGRRERFEQAFAAWQRTWSLPHIAISSSARSVTHSTEFQSLLAQGPDIIPAVVEKLVDPHNFFALQLYDRLQLRRDLIVSFDPAGDEILEGEQGRARRTVQLFAASL